MLRFSALIAIAFVVSATPAAAHQAAPPGAAASSPRAPDVEAALQDVLAGLYGFRFYRCDTPDALARLRAAAERFRLLRAPLLAAIRPERAALIEAEISVDPRFVNLPGCVPAPELDRRLTAIERAVDRLAALLSEAPPAGAGPAPGTAEPDDQAHYGTRIPRPDLSSAFPPSVQGSRVARDCAGAGRRARERCALYVAGAADQLTLDRAICPDVGDSGQADAVRLYVRSLPSSDRRHGSAIVRAALIQRFPCPSR